MKIKEVVTCMPSVVRQQARVANVVSNIAASNAQKPPTELEKVLAMRAYSDAKKQTDKNYAVRMTKQAEIANSAIRPRRG